MTTAVTAVTGIGPKTAEYLQQQGVDTAEKLLAGGVDLLSGAPGFGEARAQAVIEAAEELLGKGAGKSDDTSGKKKKQKKAKKEKNKKGKKESKGKDKGKGKEKKDKGKKKKKKK